jgi:hypothetical protein
MRALASPPKQAGEPPENGTGEESAARDRGGLRRSGAFRGRFAAVVLQLAADALRELARELGGDIGDDAAAVLRDGSA